MSNRIPRLATKLSALLLLLASAACSDSPSRVVAPDAAIRKDLSGIPSTANTVLRVTSLSPGFIHRFAGGAVIPIGGFQATGAGAIGTFEVYCINVLNSTPPVDTNFTVRSLSIDDAVLPANLPALQRVLGTTIDPTAMKKKLRQSAYLAGLFSANSTSSWDEIQAAIWKLYELPPGVPAALGTNTPALEAQFLSASSNWADDAANSTANWRVVVDARAWEPNVTASSLAQIFVTRNNPASLGNFVWHDLNADGVQEAGEPGIAGATVTATGPNGALTPIVTDANGNYLFSDLPAGEYTVCVGLPAGGFTDASPSGRDIPALDSDGTGAGNCATVTLAAGQTNLDVDFGFFKRAVTGTIGDYTWIDANGNGRQDPLEPALNGVQLQLSGTSSATLTSANGGKYLFTSLVAGNYTVRATAPAGFTFTTANAPLTTNENDSNVNPTTVTLAAGGEDLTIDFGFVPLPGSGQGCTPGFWKQSQKYRNWKWYTRADMVDAVFGVTFLSSARNNPTGPLNLLQALELNGNGGNEQLFRHGTAALLNAVYQSGVSYPFTAPQVITMVRTAWESRNATTIANTHQQLAAANERGCPLN